MSEMSYYAQENSRKCTYLEEYGNFNQRTPLYSISNNISKGGLFFALDENSTAIRKIDRYTTTEEVFSTQHEFGTQHEFSNDKILIDTRLSIKNQLKHYLSYYEENRINKEYLNYIFETSLNEILKFNPEKLSVEITHDYSLFYSIFKNDIKVYLEFFLKNEEDEDSAMLSVYKSDENMKSFGGSWHYIFEKLKSEIETTKQTYFVYRIQA